jgi:hypothetical protein
MNPEVFQRKVKVRKAKAASVRSVFLGVVHHPTYWSPLQIMMRCNSPREVAYMFRDYARKIRAKALPEDPNFSDILEACDKVSYISVHLDPLLLPFFQIEAWYDRRYSVVVPSTSMAHVNGEKSSSSTTAYSGRHPAPRGWVKHPSVITHICSTFLLIGLICLAVMYGVLGLPGGHET